MIALRRWSWIAALALSGCLFSDDEIDSRRSALRAARARWEAAGVSSYSVREAVACFCLCPSIFSVIVADGELAGVADIAPVGDVPPDELEALALLCARTIPQLFDLVGNQAETADGFDVEYDPALGYPTRIRIDPDERSADEEINVTLLEFAHAGTDRNAARMLSEGPR